MSGKVYIWCSMFKRYLKGLFDMTNLSDLLWEEMTAVQQAELEMYVLETGAPEETARLMFDVHFDCCIHNERVYAKRDIAAGNF